MSILLIGLAVEVMTSTVTSIVPGAGSSGRLETGKFSTARVPACRLRSSATVGFDGGWCFGSDLDQGLPQFEWYLGPMYRRYAEIMAERERANTAGFVKKKAGNCEASKWSSSS